jgi:hypothetical protein
LRVSGVGRFTPEELRQIDQEVDRELLEMDLRAIKASKK